MLCIFLFIVCVFEFYGFFVIPLPMDSFGVPSAKLPLAILCWEQKSLGDIVIVNIKGFCYLLYKTLQTYDFFFYSYYGGHWFKLDIFHCANNHNFLSRWARRSVIWFVVIAVIFQSNFFLTKKKREWIRSAWRTPLRRLCEIFLTRESSPPYTSHETIHTTNIDVFTHFNCRIFYIEHIQIG